ncbi:hypothetical protein WQ57_02880 [Mesobacillus campisalis]|uniref:NgoFVII family restriction endonuclease n=1 Tax=Mesobacillus campisalis TaxID=1408103 RepID=A0A0M2T0Z3_9BACI|nr:DUF881 domain-containing protein [Mesobacillus campisalis]KKK39651.1 hypothetical protein WQ57_02880 [Mesobacillus campisalis]
MGSPKNVYFAITATIIGFMVAVQFQTVSEPNVRDTRDTWELRQDLMEEKKIQSQLLQEIRSNEEKLVKYETERQQSRAEVLRDTLSELKAEAGLTAVSGPGIVLVLRPYLDEFGQGETTTYVSPYLLKRLLNELYLNGALHVSIDGQRVINTTVIREISRMTKIDGHSLNKFPLEIKVIAATQQEAEKLFNRIQGSTIVEDFFIDNLQVEIEKPGDDIEVPAYQDPIRIRYMEPAESGKGGGE